MTYNDPKKHVDWSAWEKKMGFYDKLWDSLEEKARLRRPRTLRIRWEREEARKFNRAWTNYFIRSSRELDEFELGFNPYVEKFTVENIHTYLDIYKRRKSRWERNRRFIRSALFFLFLCIFI